MMRRIQRDFESQSGMAMLLTVLLTLLLSAIAVAAIQRAGEELTVGGQSRRTTRTLFAAEAGLQVAFEQVGGRVTPDLTCFSRTLVDGTVVRSGVKGDTSCQNITSLGSSPKPPDGWELGKYRTYLYRANVTASIPSGSAVELESQFGRVGEY